MPPGEAIVKHTSDLIQLKTPGLSGQLLRSQRAGLGSALSRWHGWIWVRYVASLLCLELGCGSAGRRRCERKPQALELFKSPLALQVLIPFGERGTWPSEPTGTREAAHSVAALTRHCPRRSGHSHFLVWSHLPDHPLRRHSPIRPPLPGPPPPPSLSFLPLPLPGSPLVPLGWEAQCLPWGGWRGRSTPQSRLPKVKCAQALGTAAHSPTVKGTLAESESSSCGSRGRLRWQPSPHLLLWHK